jgi:hypothetical protein
MIEILDAERRRVNKVRIYKLSTAEDTVNAEVRTRSV